MPRDIIFRISVWRMLFTINSIFADHKLNLTDYNSLCKKICESSDRIVGAWAFGLDNLIASDVKPRFAEPDKAEQERMFIQAQIMQSIVSSNEGMYGKVKHIIVSFEHFDAFLFPLMWGAARKMKRRLFPLDASSHIRRKQSCQQ